MDSYRRLKLKGTTSQSAKYKVLIDGKDVDYLDDCIFSFVTKTSFHDSLSISIVVEKGWIRLEKCTASYPATFNGISGTATIIQPIESPIAVIENNTINQIPFNITINENETFNYEHLMLNGPSKLLISIKDQEMYENIDFFVGNFLTKEISKGITDIQTEYNYNPKPNDIYKEEDLEKLKSLVINKHIALTKNT